MALFNAFQDNSTLVSKIDPRTKLVWLILVYAEAMLATKVWQFVLLLSLILVVFRLGGIAWRQLKLTYIVLVVMSAQMLIFQLLFRHSGEYWYLAPWLKIDQIGAIIGIMSGLRLSCLVLAGMAFLQLTHPTDLILLIMKGGLGYRYAMLIGLAIRFLPLMESELVAIYESQRARGLPLSGPWQQLKGLIPVTLPFMFRAIKRSQSVALAMELQGFGLHRERTFLRTLRLQPMDYGLLACFGLALLAIIFGINN